MKEDTVDKIIFKKFIFGYTLFFIMFGAGVLGAIVMEGHWIGMVGRVSVDWGIILMAIFHIFLNNKMKKKEKEQKALLESTTQETKEE